MLESEREWILFNFMPFFFSLKWKHIVRERTNEREINANRRFYTYECIQEMHNKCAASVLLFRENRALKRANALLVQRTRDTQYWTQLMEIWYAPLIPTANAPIAFLSLSFAYTWFCAQFFFFNLKRSSKNKMYSPLSAYFDLFFLFFWLAKDCHN